jgi:predicted dehydrogenase
VSIKVGVIGTGYLGQHHARIYSEIEGVELKALIDVNESRAEELAARYNCKAYSDYKEIIKSLDAVSIVTPTVTHYKIAIDCLKQGKDVLLEKPITFDVTEADKLINESQKKHCILQIGHIERYNPAFVALSGMVKKPKFLESKRLSPFTGRGTDVDITLDLMIHDVDIILGLVSSKVKTIRARGMKMLSNKIDFAEAWLEFENGSAASLTASRISPERQRALTVFQKDSYLVVDYQNSEIRQYSKNTNEMLLKTVSPEKKEPLKEEIIDFLRCVRQRKKPLVSGIDGRNALKTVLDINKKI